MVHTVQTPDHMDEKHVCTLHIFDQWPVQFQLQSNISIGQTAAEGAESAGGLTNLQN